jgi:hypothetical protein
MFPEKEGFPGTEDRRKILTEMLAKEEVTELGKKLFGLENW